MRATLMVGVLAAGSSVAFGADAPLKAFFGFSDPFGDLQPGESSVEWPTTIDPTGPGQAFWVSAPVANGNGRVVDFENYTGNTTFIDDNYMAAGNSSLISGNAWWSNATGGSNRFFGLGLQGFSQTDVEGVPLDSAKSVAFDLAWAVAGSDAPMTLTVRVNDAFDVTGRQAIVNYDLQPFLAGPAFGGFNGAQGTIKLELASLVDLSNPNNPLPLRGINNIDISFDNIASGGPTVEVAIDNVSINRGSPLTRVQKQIPANANFSDHPMAVQHQYFSASILEGNADQEVRVSFETVPADETSTGKPDGVVGDYIQVEVDPFIGDQEPNQQMVILMKAEIPYLDVIENSFGQATDQQSAVNYVLNNANIAAWEMAESGAAAYATGDKIVFQSAPDLFTAAHEAAHAIQQRVPSGFDPHTGISVEVHEGANALADKIVIDAYIVTDHNTFYAITLVPEPSTTALVMMALPAILRRRR